MESPWELGDWVPEALLRTSSISVRVSTRFPRCKWWLFARKFTPCSRLHPGAAHPGSFLWNALCRQSLKLLHESFFFELGLPLDLEAKPKCISFQLALHSSGVLQSSGATNSTSSGWQSLAPFLCGFWGEILMSHWGRREHGKLGTTLHWCWWHW